MLSAWRRLNAERAITGVLLHHDASVFQVLEGFPDAIAALYAAIARDGRHAVTKLIDEPIASRSFGDWSIGHARVVGEPGRARGGAAGVPASLRPFVDPGFRFWHCDEAMARTLVGGFTTGPWRRAIR
jgi:hypothetical protein